MEGRTPENLTMGEFSGKKRWLVAPREQQAILIVAS